MKKINFKSINTVMGKGITPIQRKFMKKNNVKLSPDQELELKDKGIIKRNKTQPFNHGSKPNNNDLCPCGSKRKFKLCCKLK
jgi:uncharacterized protein YecA (UPF0149 family)